MSIYYVVQGQSSRRRPVEGISVRGQIWRIFTHPFGKDDKDWYRKQLVLIQMLLRMVKPLF